jgi:hypothetical protein
MGLVPALGALAWCVPAQGHEATAHGESGESEAVLEQLAELTGLRAGPIDISGIAKGEGPPQFQAHAGAPYKPSRNEDPSIPAQCWIETGYGSQNACKYCHTVELARRGHGNAWPMDVNVEAQVLYAFPSPNLNRVNWDNVIHPQRLVARLEEAGLAVPRPGDAANLNYVRTDNWRAAYAEARPDGDETWDNRSNPDSPLRLLPALDPDHLYSWRAEDATEGGRHGYVDREGFVRNERGGYTGWRAVNFFPYAIFTPLTGSVSGIYIRLPQAFRTQDGEADLDVYRRNLALLERQIKARAPSRATYFGDANQVPVRPGFYPVGTEFAHPLHYVDLAADGERGTGLDGVAASESVDYEFPGTRSKRVKEVRYLYKWKDVSLEDIGEDEEGGATILGREWQGWIDNQAGWILAAYIEDRKGELRPQTTEELLQCLGCHSRVGNTVDAVWSLQRKLPGALGWGEMDYGAYDSAQPGRTRLADYRNPGLDKGELEYFFWSVVGADLFGVMPAQIAGDLKAYAEAEDLAEKLGIGANLDLVFDDGRLSGLAEGERRPLLEARAAIMRHYADARAYLARDDDGQPFIRGRIFYPSEQAMHANIALYRRVVLDQSYNLGKTVFGTEPGEVPFTFRSDGSVRDAGREVIPVGQVIVSRPWGSDGVGTTPTGIARVDEDGRVLSPQGKAVDVLAHPERAARHISRGGTFHIRYDPILSDEPVSAR